MSANFSKTVLDRLACSGAEVSSLHGYESDIYIPGEVGGTGGSLKPIAMAKMGTSWDGRVILWLVVPSNFQTYRDGKNGPFLWLACDGKKIIWRAWDGGGSVASM